MPVPRSLHNVPCPWLLSSTRERLSPCTPCAPASLSALPVIYLTSRVLPTTPPAALLLDGVAIDELDEAKLRSLITWLPQEPPLFPLSIEQNIAYGAGEDVSHDAVVAAAKAANAHEFISRLPDGYETTIGASGGSLSGGQRQRVAIARALLRDPAVLMLDEPTSALDPRSAELVEEALRRASAERSVVLITHKISQAAMCDRVIVLDHGRVVEEGTHAELVRHGGKYAEMLQQGSTSGGVVEEQSEDPEDVLLKAPGGKVV